MRIFRTTGPVMQLWFLPVFLFLVITACNKPQDDPAPTDPASPTDTVPSPGGSTPSRAKVNRLVRITPSDGFYPNFTLTYDSAARLKTINTIYHVYWKNDTIDHIFNTYTLNGEIKALSNIFLYNANKQCYKILSKTRSSWTNGVASVAETSPFFSDPTDGQWTNYDSLVYSASGQLIETWSGDKYGQQKILALQYASAQAAAPGKIQYFGPAQELWWDLALTTNDTDQPIFNTLWFLPFMRPADNVYGSLHAPVTPQTTPGFFYVYMPIVKKCVTQWKFSSYTGGSTEYGYNSIYYYNSDSTLFTGRRDPDDIIFDRFTYGFQKL